MNQATRKPLPDTPQPDTGAELASPLAGPARPPLKVLVLGGSGYLGQRLLQTLAACPEVQALGSSRRTLVRTAGADQPQAGAHWQRVDSCDLSSVRAALTGVDAVVNCVAGDAAAIAEGARVLVQAALQAGRPRIVHLSSQAVYGGAEGWVQEDAPLDPGLGWYGRAKCQAEAQLRHYASEGGQSVILRPGCIHGPGSQLWVGRIGRWLQAGRLGELGAAGDGWSNLVHVDDVVSALMTALWRPLAPGEQPVWNLAAPDSPRWNEYFVDLALALALDATPVRRLGRQLRLDAWLAGPPLKLAEIALQKIGGRTASGRGWAGRLPEAIPPGLLRLWRQELRLDSSAGAQLGLRFMPYEASLAASVQWFAAQAQQQKKREKNQQHQEWERAPDPREAARVAQPLRVESPPAGARPAPETAGYP